MPQQTPETEPMARLDVDNVMIRNSSRQALLINLPGQSLRLQPGATAELPRAYLGTEELAKLVGAGSVRVIAPPPSAPGEVRQTPAPEAAPGENAGAEETATAGSPRSSKKLR